MQDSDNKRQLERPIMGRAGGRGRRCARIVWTNRVYKE